MTHPQTTNYGETRMSRPVEKTQAESEGRGVTVDSRTPTDNGSKIAARAARGMASQAETSSNDLPETMGGRRTRYLSRDSVDVDRRIHGAAWTLIIAKR